MSSAIADTLADEKAKGSQRFLFVACFVALVATSFAFMTRIMLMDEWQLAFRLSETQKGEILGAGFWPFGISIVLFSLVIDRIGYGKSMIFAFACHVVSAILLITAKGYWGLYIGSILNGLAAGTVEAVINPAIATMYTKNKTKMLTILHAGWPGGLMLCGLVLLTLGKGAAWTSKAGVILVPTLVYGVMLLKCKFPPSERVAAGVPYRDMLKEAGALGAFIVAFMIMAEVGRVFKMPNYLISDVIMAATICYFVYTLSAGRTMYIFLLVVMILLAITELGTDAWIRELLRPAMRGLNLDAGWVLVYTATIMMVLRFCIGPIVKVLKPLGVLLVSALFAAAGLYLLADARAPMWLLITATIYGTGQTFFWPVTLGVVSERFPKGGALTLNAIAGVGMLGVGILGTPGMGYVQDKYISTNLDAALYERVVEEEAKTSVFGPYSAIDVIKENELKHKVELYKARDKAGTEEYQKKVAKAFSQVITERAGDDVSQEDMLATLKSRGLLIAPTAAASATAENDALQKVKVDAKRYTMQWVAILPLVMAVCYLGLIVYFKSKGGYKAIELSADGQVAGERDVTPQQAVADEEATPSE